MRLNAQTSLSTSQILLVPYTSHQVPTYHDWMQSPSLQAATASEPLSLPEEYEMCRSWRADADKLTFVICLPLPSGQKSVTPKVDDAPERMVGDINLFLFRPDDEDEPSGEVVGEVELMIAKTELQRKGYGRAALLAFLGYVLGKWRDIGDEYGEKNAKAELSFLRVKVNETNAGSLRLFESVGFSRVGEGANYFGEIEMRGKPDLEELKRLKGWESVEDMGYVLN